MKLLLFVDFLMLIVLALVIHGSINDSHGRNYDRVQSSYTYTARPTARPTPSPSPVPTFTTLSRGSSGTEVANLQRRLNAFGLDCGTADGIYGAKTEAAVREFQRMVGITQDGIAGQETMLMLYKLQGAAVPTPRPSTPKTGTRGSGGGSSSSSQRPQQQERTVWITATGECYHSIPRCGNTKTSYEVTLSEAIDDGYRRCSNCF